MNDRLIPITDTAGRSLMSPGEPEPLPGSVMLTDGAHGHAWQRHFNDGLWYPVRGGKGRTWEQLLTCRNCVLVYDAEPRPAGAVQTVSTAGVGA